MDTSDDTGSAGLAQFVRSLPAKPATTIRFFDRGDYYTTHGDDALFIAKEVFRTMGVVKNHDSKLPHVCLSRMVYENTLRDLLLVRQYRVEVYQSKGKNAWRLTRKGSPGNLQMFEDVVYSAADVAATSAYIMAVRLSTAGGERVVGVAYADASLCKIGVAEFTDNDQFSNFEAFVVQVSAKECLMASDAGSPDLAKLRLIAERSNVMVTSRKKSEFATRDIKQDLGRLLKLKEGTAVSTVPELDLQHAMGATSCLINYLELLGDETNFGQYSLFKFDFAQFMKLDAAAVHALNLLPTAQQQKSMSVAGLLNRCKTTQGQRLLLHWVKQPLLDKRRIEQRLDLVEVFFESQELRQLMQEDHLKRFPDFNRISKKFQRHKGSLQDCVRVFQAVLTLPALKDTLELYEGPHSVLLKAEFVEPIQDLIKDFEKFQLLVETTVDLEATDNHEYVIRADYNEELTELKQQMDKLKSDLPKVASKVASDLGLVRDKGLKLEQDGRFGYVFRVSRKDEKALRGSSKYETLDTQKSGVKFRNSKLRAINDEYQDLMSKYEEQQATIVREILAIAEGYAEPMEALNDVIANLDVLISFAQASAMAPIPYVRPKLTEQGKGNIRVMGCRHPCVEVQEDVNFIANDVQLIRGKSEFQIITGPNMGGKSTYIRQIGVAVLMAQIGCFVAADEAEISITDCILARVGAGDSQLKGVSTFMAEMLETASILKSATPTSLLIIDELGRGTSTYDGFGLAWAISEYIVKEKKGLCLFATHFHELTEMAKLYDVVTNLHVSALPTKESLTLLYKVKPGVCDQSFGIHVAELANFPQAVVRLAKRKAQELEDYQEEGGDAGDDRKRARQEGERLITQFLKDCTAAAKSAASPEAAMQEVVALRDTVLASNNPFVQELVQAS